MTITRRSFMEMAVALGAAAAWGRPTAARSKVSRRERRDLYPEGVASGDPQSSSVLLWTRRASKDGNGVKKLTAEVAGDPSFGNVVAERFSQRLAQHPQAARSGLR
ncbi:MAG TPA: PhoD-like phosphatase N-terminal domain-containing protein [Candidatus Sulfotelmatobacter sp.]